MPEKNVFLRHLTWEDIGSALSDPNAVVIVPVGSIEQHGPHLPIEVDSLIAENLAGAVASSIVAPPRVFVAPTICFGCSEHHLAFPGTITLSHETFIAMVEDILRSLHSAGARRVFLLNGHGGNYAALCCVVQRLQIRLSCLLSVANWWNMAKQRLSEVRSSEPGGAGHAGELETSIMQHLAAHLVKQEKFRTHYPTQPELFFPRDMLRQQEKHGAVVYLPTEYLSKTGQLGDPTHASPEKGAKFFDIVVDELVQFVRSFSRCPIPGTEDE